MPISFTTRSEHAGCHHIALGDRVWLRNRNLMPFAMLMADVEIEAISACFTTL